MDTERPRKDRERREDRKHRHRHSHHDEDRHRSDHQHHHKRRKLSPESEDRRKRKHRHREHEKDISHRGERAERKDAKQLKDEDTPTLKRDSWMDAPSSLDIDYTRKGARAQQPPTKHIQTTEQTSIAVEEPPSLTIRSEVDYEFGDSGSKWRMTRLKAVFQEAKESDLTAEEIALERYGNLQAFDEAREEQLELERRELYAPGYSIKNKPDGGLFRERRLGGVSNHGDERPQLANAVLDARPVEHAESKAPVDQTTLNKLKAQMMKAKLKGSTDATRLESEYNTALASSSSSGPDVVVLNAMENRMLTNGRSGEVIQIDNKRGRERGLVKENDDMSIEDMIREERRTRGQAGGDGRRFADRIAKDAKFDNDLEYMDENAEKLAKRVQKSEVNLRSAAISDFQKTNRILDKCPLCHHEDTQTPPVAPLVSLATRVYMTLPTDPEIGDGGACIVPIQHRSNLLECDDDEWDEIRNFMKCLIRMYHDQGRDVIFYENAAHPQKMKHAAMEVVPLPYSLGETAPAFFKEAILTSDEKWTQHSKVINTQAKARNGLGRLAFRKTLAKEMPYFHVWFDLDGGLGHIVEDTRRWPKGDLFAREVIGGMLDVGPEIIKRQGRWQRDDSRLAGFTKRWTKFDWTKVLTDG